MPHSALLLHVPPSGPPHLDWLLPHASPQDDLITFRLARLPQDVPPDASLPATRIQDHRPLYLDFEGELSEGRGLVRRLARVPAVTLDETPESLRFEVDWAANPARYLARLVAGDQWTITRLPPDRA